MRISATYLITIMKYGYPPKPEDDFRSLEALRALGFHYLEMEGLGPVHAENVRTRVKDYEKALADNDIHIHNFCIVDPDLVSLDSKKQQAAFDHFKRMTEVGLALGTETFHLASYAPPVRYLGRAPYQLDGGEYEFGARTRLSIPDDFSWRRVWDNLVSSCRFCADYVGQFGRTILMEPRVGEIICSVDSLLRLIEQTGCENLSANFDTGHFSAQREDVCLALMKMEGKFKNIHIADNDPKDTDHLPIGDGLIDWEEFFRILKRFGYEGYLGIDIGAKTDAELTDGLLRSRDAIRRYCDAAGLPVEW